MLVTTAVGQRVADEERNKLQLDRAQTIIKAFEEFLVKNTEYQTTNLDQFILNFNAWFVNFEKDVNKKLDI